MAGNGSNGTGGGIARMKRSRGAVAVAPVPRVWNGRTLLPTPKRRYNWALNRLVYDCPHCGEPAIIPSGCWAYQSALPYRVRTWEEGTGAGGLLFSPAHAQELRTVCVCSEACVAAVRERTETELVLLALEAP